MSELEYKTVKVQRQSQRQLDKALNKQAKDGWELAEVRRGTGFTRFDHVIFRRTKR